MSLFTRRALLPAATLLLAVANAQSCYYPDGKTLSQDIPCDPNAPASSCCGSNSFCLTGGLCYTGGMVTRGSCTDKSWNSQACSAYCTDEDTSTEIAITPCTSGGDTNTFVCGVGKDECQKDDNTFTLSSDTSLVLRPGQIAALVQDSLESSTTAQTTVTATPEGYYTGGAMAGLGIGIALPLLAALGIMYFLLRRERSKFGHSKPKNLMYKLPDEDNDHPTARSPPPPPVTVAPFPSFASNRSSHISQANSMATSMATSRRASLRTVQTQSSRPVLSGHFPSGHAQSFLERYENMKRNAQVQSMEASTVSAQELDSTPTSEVPRYELSNTRMST